MPTEHDDIFAPFARTISESYMSLREADALIKSRYPDSIVSCTIRLTPSGVGAAHFYVKEWTDHIVVRFDLLRINYEGVSHKFEVVQRPVLEAALDCAIEGRADSYNHGKTYEYVHE